MFLTGIAVAGLAGIGSAAAQDAIATTDLNMRAGPGPQYPVVTTIAGNGAVGILGCTGSWCDVVSDGHRGWAYSAYLAYDIAGAPVIVPEAGTRVEVPAATFEVATYWDENYRDRPFYSERDTYAAGNVAAGATTGAIAGAVVGGPLGAAVGGIAGAAIGGATTPPERVRTYVVENEVEPVLLEGEVVVGASLPEPVTLYPVPDYEYQYAIVNGQRVLIDPGTRTIVYVYR
jgi:uncharacterized protein YraI